MEKKNFLIPQELFNSLRDMRQQVKENLIGLMKANNLTYVHTDVDVCSDANCETCYCRVYDREIGCEFVSSVQGVRLTADDKLEFDWSDEDNDKGTIEERKCECVDVMNIYSTVYSLLVRDAGDDFNYKAWIEENANLYK